MSKREAMRKKDFELIAGALARIEDVAARTQAAEYMADALATTNPKFDRVRFLALCNVPTREHLLATQR
jgi:hypothetical protein